MVKQKLEGVPLRLGGKDYILPPLNLEALEENWEGLQSLGIQETTPQQRIKVIIDLLHAGLARNYPRRWGLWGGISRKRLKRDLDFPALLALYDTLMKASGLERRQPGEPGAGSALTGGLSGPG
jgi:hypothetical protein